MFSFVLGIYPEVELLGLIENGTYRSCPTLQNNYAVLHQQCMNFPGAPPHHYTLYYQSLNFIHLSGYVLVSL